MNGSVEVISLYENISRVGPFSPCPGSKR